MGPIFTRGLRASREAKLQGHGGTPVLQIAMPSLCHTSLSWEGHWTMDSRYSHVPSTLKHYL
jgi:hypothetical protein